MSGIFVSEKHGNTFNFLQPMNTMLTILTSPLDFGQFEFDLVYSGFTHNGIDFILNLN